MDKHNKELRKYFKEIKRQTRTYGSSSHLLDDLKNNIYCYLSDCPDVAMQDILEKYGTPSELAGEFFQHMDMETFEKKTLLAKFFKQFLFVCCLLFIVVLLWLFIDRQIDRPVTVDYNIESNL